MTDLVKRVADAVYHRDSTDTYAIARVAIKTVLDDMREWTKSRGYADHTICFPALDAYEKDRMK